nr:hypothetical protein [uncultured Desulfobulbus sp.]
MNPLCADCGREISPNEWKPPETSLCPACERKIEGNKVAWSRSDKEPNAPEPLVIHQKAA